MIIAIRQHGKPLLTLRTTATRNVTDRDLARAVAAANGSTEVQTGYYDVVLTADPKDPNYDVDSVIQIK